MDGLTGEPQRAVTNDEVERFWRDGVVHLPGILDPSWVAALAEQFDAYVWFDETRALTPLAEEHLRRAGRGVVGDVLEEHRRARVAVDVVGAPRDRAHLLVPVHRRGHARELALILEPAQPVAHVGDDAPPSDPFVQVCAPQFANSKVYQSAGTDSRLPISTATSNTARLAFTSAWSHLAV